GRCLISDANDLVRCLTIELEIEFCLRTTIIPVAKRLEFTAPKPSLRPPGALDKDAYPGSLSFNTLRPRESVRRRHDSFCGQAMTALVFACEHVNDVACRYAFTAVHRLLPGEGKYLYSRICYFYLDRIEHIFLAFPPSRT